MSCAAPGVTKDFDPSLWGPCAWKFLHFVAFAYPNAPTDEQRERHATFFRALADVLPCAQCRRHYAADLPTNDDFVRDRASLSRWVFEIHNGVNDRTDKPTVDFDRVEREYSNDALVCGAAVEPKSLLQQQKCAVLRRRAAAVSAYHTGIWVAALVVLVIALCLTIVAHRRCGCA